MNDGLRLHEAYESKRHGSFVNNDTRHRHGRLSSFMAFLSACRDGAVCGLRIADADPQQLLAQRTDSERIFLNSEVKLRSQ